MKGIITKEGKLKLHRFVNFRRQGVRYAFCPFQFETRCGEQCPHFGEPDPETRWTLEICHGKVLKFETLTFEDFTEKG